MTNNDYLIGPIRTDADYRTALQLVAPYFENEPEIDSDAGAHFEAMLTLIEAYEARHYPIDPPDPVDAIKFRMEQQGLKPKDLEPMIGQRNRVYEVLNGKRKLTMAMVWKLHIGLGIPAVYRPSTFSSWGRTIVVKVNGITSTELTSCTFAKLKLPSGIHRFDAALKPWPFDRSTVATSITASISSDRPTYIGYYPNELSAPEVSATFISYPDIRKDKYPHFFGVAYPKVASKEMVSCSAVKSLHE